MLTLSLMNLTEPSARAVLTPPGCRLRAEMIACSPGESARLRALAEHHDGFKLAEIDLELRGEGEIIGTRQHGLAEFRVARLPEDADLLDRARRYARSVLEDDAELTAPEHALLAEALRAAYGAEALEPIPA